jgi:uncharacterized protein (TIRG00374 family)
MAGSDTLLRRLLLAGKLAVTIVLLLLVLQRVDWRLMASSIGQLDTVAVILALLSFMTIAALEVGRLRVALAPFDLSWLELTRLHIIGVFFGSFLPGQVGADIYKVVVLRPRDRGSARPLTLVLLLRLLGLTVLLFGAMLSLLLAGQVLWQRLHELPATWRLSPLLVIAVAAGMLAAAAVLLSLPGLRQRVSRFLRRYTDQILDAVLAVTTGQVVVLVILSLLILGARMMVIWFLTTATGVSLSAGEALLVVTFATLITLIPISFAGLGLREGVVTFLLISLSVSYESAVLVALLGRGLILLLSALGGLWLVVRALRPTQAAPDTSASPPA